jgi:hypothetical protein
MNDTPKINCLTRFNDVTEFLEELTATQRTTTQRVVDDCVRLTRSYQQSKISPNIEHICVVSGFLKVTDWGWPLLTELECYCGEVWKGLPNGEKALTAAEHHMQKIENHAKMLGLAIRPGRYLYA